VTLLGRTWLSPRSFEISVSRPEGFAFAPGQSIQLGEGPLERAYSLSCATDSPRLTLCVRAVKGGVFSARLAEAPIGTGFTLAGPHGYFTFRPSPRAAFFVATGTGVAPFLSMVRSGTRGFTLLHGARSPSDLYFRETFRAAAALYVGCVTGGGGEFSGRVSDWLRTRLAPGGYNFYLCGARDMVRDVTVLVDERLPGSRVYTEIFH
jgi:ferredoxin-NADP reductase